MWEEGVFEESSVEQFDGLGFVVFKMGRGIDFGIIDYDRMWFWFLVGRIIWGEEK